MNTKNVLPGEPAQLKITAKRNDTFQYAVRGWDASGDPYDFSNHTFLMQVKKDKDDDVAVIDITDADFTITQDSIGSNAGVSNVIKINHAATNMDLTPREYYYDIEMTDPAGDILTFQEGIFNLTQDVSR